MEKKNPMGDTCQCPIKLGITNSDKLGELVPKAEALLTELCNLKTSLKNGAWDWPKLDIGASVKKSYH